MNVRKRRLVRLRSAGHNAGSASGCAMKQRGQTILQGEMAERARAGVSQIAKAVKRAAEHLTPEQPAWHGGGPAEFTLFFGCLAAATERPDYITKAGRFLELAARLFSANSGPTWYGGVRRLSRTVRHLSGLPSLR